MAEIMTLSTEPDSLRKAAEESQRTVERHHRRMAPRLRKLEAQAKGDPPDPEDERPSIPSVVDERELENGSVLLDPFPSH